MEKINVAELLKDCPMDMELDCALSDDVRLVAVDMSSNYPICISIGDRQLEHLTAEGFLSSLAFSNKKRAKCVIFPKGKTTWEGFQRPFKDGDVVALDTTRGVQVFIFKEYIDAEDEYAHCYMVLDDDGAIDFECGNYYVKRFATEEEKAKLFQAIKANGYKWNAGTKTSEKLVEPKFKIEKGKWYVCTKDLLDNYANKAFCKGDTYLSTQDGSLIPSNSNVPFEVVCDSTYFRDWTINDAKDGDVLAAHECLVLFKKLDGLNIKCYCTYHFMNYPSFYVDTLQNKDAFHPATKEQRDLLFQKMKEAGYDSLQRQRTPSCKD